MLPEWLRDTDSSSEIALAPQRGGKRRSFWRRTLSTLAGTLAKEVMSNESQAVKGFLQCLDPRAKLISILMLVVTTTFIQSIPVLWISIGFSLALAVLSRIRIRSLILAMAPVTIFTALITIPAALSVVTSGHPLVSIGGVSITESGLHSAAKLVSGAIAAVCWVSLLMLTTSWSRLLSALNSLRIPQMFVLTMMMSYRYLFVFIRDAEAMHLAKESRTITRDKGSNARGWVTGRMGDLFMRSRRLSDQVYLSMASRGFSGEARGLEGPGMDGKSVGTVVVSLVIAALLFIIDKT